MGSIEGGGTIYLGANELTIGQNGLNTTFSGQISDCGGDAGVSCSNISTGGSLVKKGGSSTLTLAGQTFYTGATTVKDGVLAAGATNVFSPNSAFVVGFLPTSDCWASATCSPGQILDLGGFSQTIGSLAGNGTVSNSGVASPATLTIGNDNSDTTFSGVIQDGTSATALTKIGTGSFTLSNTSTYTGATTVNAGALSVTGNISSSSLLTVNSAGTLNGTGTVGNTQINAFGTFAPGVPGVPGTSMTVAGNLAFQPSAIYLVQINPSSTTSANVTGTASLAGNVLAAFAPGSYIEKQYTILHSAGLNGTTFDAHGTTNLPGGFTTNLSYTNTDVLLNLTAVLAQQIPGMGSNQSGVANGLNNFFNNGGTLSPNFLTVFGLSGGNLVNALTQLSGQAGAGGGAQAAIQTTNAFLPLLLNPNGGSPSTLVRNGFAAEQELSPEVAQAYAAVTPKDVQSLNAPFGARYDRRWGVWGQAYGGFNRTNGDSSAGTRDTTAHSYGVATGADYRVSPDMLLGFALAGGGTNFSVSDGLGGGHSDMFQIGIYGSKQFGPAYFSAGLSYAWHRMTTDRIVTVTGTDHLTAEFDAHNLGGRAETGYRITTSVVGITPYAALQVQDFHTPSYAETAISGSNAFALAYGAKTVTTSRVELGSWLDKAFALNSTSLMTLRARAAWAHDHSSDQNVTALFQTLPGSSFTTNGAGTVPNSALLSAGAEIKLANRVSFGAKLDGEFSSRSQTYAGTGTVRYDW